MMARSAPAWPLVGEPVQHLLRREAVNANVQPVLRHLELVQRRTGLKLGRPRRLPQFARPQPRLGRRMAGMAEPQPLFTEQIVAERRSRRATTIVRNNRLHQLLALRDLSLQLGIAAADPGFAGGEQVRDKAVEHRTVPTFARQF